MNVCVSRVSLSPPTLPLSLSLSLSPSLSLPLSLSLSLSISLSLSVLIIVDTLYEDNSVVATAGKKKGG